jgi:hypothetical protein
MATTPAPAGPKPPIRLIAVAAGLGVVLLVIVIWLAGPMIGGQTKAGSTSRGGGTWQSSNPSGDTSDGPVGGTAQGPVGTTGPGGSRPGAAGATGALEPGGGGPPPPRIKIDVAGATLDYTNPDQTCTTVSNKGFDSPLTVEVVTVDVDRWLRSESSHCRSHADADHPQEARRACKTGIVLRRNGEGCYVGIAERGDVPLDVQPSATVTLRIKARCTSRTGQPCQALGSEHEPSTAAPIDVYWTTKGAGLTLNTREGPEENTGSGTPGIEPPSSSPPPAGDTDPPR